MKKDTEKALEIIAPMAKELNIKVAADDTFLYCNGQAIGIGCNSTYATVNEFIQYAFWYFWKKWKSEKMPSIVTETIQRYWFSDAQMEMWRKEQRMIKKKEE